MKSIKHLLETLMNKIKVGVRFFGQKTIALRKRFIHFRIRLIPHRKKIIVFSIITVFVLSSFFAVLIPLKNRDRLNMTMAADLQKLVGAQASPTPIPSAAISDDTLLYADDNEDADDDYDNAEDENDSHGTGGGADSGSSGTYYSITFEPNGGDSVKAVKVKKNKTLKTVPRTQKANSTFLGWYTDDALTEKFYQSDPIIDDVTLYAKYSDMETKEATLYEKFTISDANPNLTFQINNPNGLSSAEMLAQVTLTVEDGSRYVSLEATGGNPCTISAKNGFTPGASYTLSLGDGLTFKDKPDTCRKCTFYIHKDEVVNLSIRSDIVFIPAEQVSDIHLLNGDSIDSIAIALFGNPDTTAGRFTYSGTEALDEGMLVCVYEGTHPNNRDENGDYSDEDVAYIKITENNSGTIYFKNIEQENIENVLFMPDTFPIDVQDYDLGEAEFTDGAFNFDFDPADFMQYSDLGITDSTTLDAGDFIVLYNQEDTSFTAYYEITSASDEDMDGVYAVMIVAISLADMQEAMDYYVTKPISGQALVSGMDIAELEEQIEDQAKVSGLAEKTLNYLAVLSTQTDGFKAIDSIQDYTLTDESGNPLSDADIEALSKKMVTIQDTADLSVDADIVIDSDDNVNSLSVILTIRGSYSFDTSDNETIKVNITSSLTQRVTVVTGISGGAEISYYKILGVPIPYISDYQMTAVVDVWDYTNFSFDVTVQSASLPDKYHITDQLNDLLEATDREELESGVSGLLKEYSKMLETETDYIEIYSKDIVDKEGWVDPFHILVYNMGIAFKVKTNINVALGANFMYRSGTRYIFWFKVEAQKSGSNTMDLMDEELAFRFYLMGKIGVRVGIEFSFSVGFFSTKLANVGLSAEVGPYVELYGYFIYEFHKIRAANTPVWLSEETMVGALFIEIGIYFDLAFNADALSGSYTYSYDIVSEKWPILTIGEKINVYDFGYEVKDTDCFLLHNTNAKALLPFYRRMSVIDLTTGTFQKIEYPISKFSYDVSSRYFDYNPVTNMVTVNPPDGAQYLKCDLTLTWRSDKLAFSKYDYTSTVHLVWTTLSGNELSKEITVSVVVNGETVWDELVYQNMPFTLPSEERVLDMMGYDNCTVMIDDEPVNLKYSGYSGYEAGLNLEQMVTDDRIYEFEVQERTYTLDVRGVVDAGGSTSTKTFSAKYQESFDVSTLNNTGQRTNPFTRFAKITCSDGDEDGFDAFETIGRDFAIQLLAGNTDYTAEYIDNSCAATCHYVPDAEVDVPDQTIVVEKGSVPEFDSVNYLSGFRPEMMVGEWMVKVGKVTEDTTFVASCVFAKGDIYTIAFEENGGSEIKDYKRYFDQEIWAPTDPEREGYTFAGWYADEACTGEVYVFERMPESDLTLYAKWEGVPCEVTFDAKSLGTLADDEKEKTFLFGGAYGELPVPMTDQYHGFIGWYSTENFDEESLVTSETIVSTVGPHVLYANYKSLIEIPSTEAVPVEQTVNTTYNKQAYNYLFTLAGSLVQGETDLYYPTEGYTVRYMRIKDGDGRAITNPEYEATAINAGTYTVQIRRDADDTFQAFLKTYSDALVINKADRDYAVPVPTLHSQNYYSITLNPIEIPDPDGVIMYGLGNVWGGLVEDDETWTTSCTITDFGRFSGNYAYLYVFTKVEGGENYNDAMSDTYLYVDRNGQLPESGASSEWTFYMSDNAGYFDSGRPLEEVYAVVAGSESFSEEVVAGEFEAGNTVSGQVDYDMAPWMVERFMLGIENFSDYDGGMFERITIDAYGETFERRNVGLNAVSYRDNVGYCYLLDVEANRVIESVGSFEDWGGDYNLDTAPGDTITLSYDGTAVDQFTDYSDLSYDEPDPPILTVEMTGSEAGKEAIYCGTYYYSNYEFVVDVAAMQLIMQQEGVETISFSATLIFPTQSTTQDTAVWTQDITIHLH